MTVPNLLPPESIHQIVDEAGGVVGAIVIDSTILGPAAGGCRLWYYATEAEMITDAKRLARGMSYKNAMAGLPFGGGKAVLNKPLGNFDRHALYARLGDTIETLGGQYVTAEDVGSTLADMAVVKTRTRYVSGLEAKANLAGGDPSVMTALGVYESMKLVAETHFGLPLNGATVAVQGTGNVGTNLCRYLRAAGAKLVIADVDTARVAALGAELGARVVGVEEILSVEADILAPCALGAILNSVTIPRLSVKFVCGAANNQLAIESDGEALLARGIVYVPDYVVNAGGIINATAEYLGESDALVRQRVDQIPARVCDIIARAKAQNEPTSRIADAMAQSIILQRSNKLLA